MFYIGRLIKSPNINFTNHFSFSRFSIEEKRKQVYNEGFISCVLLAVILYLFFCFQDIQPGKNLFNTGVTGSITFCVLVLLARIKKSYLPIKIISRHGMMTVSTRIRTDYVFYAHMLSNILLPKFIYMSAGKFLPFLSVPMWYIFIYSGPLFIIITLVLFLLHEIEEDLYYTTPKGSFFKLLLEVLEGRRITYLLIGRFPFLRHFLSNKKPYIFEGSFSIRETLLVKQVCTEGVYASFATFLFVMFSMAIVHFMPGIFPIYGITQEQVGFIGGMLLVTCPTIFTYIVGQGLVRSYCKEKR